MKFLMWMFLWTPQRACLGLLIITLAWAKLNDVKPHNVLLYKEPISFFYSFWKRGDSLRKAKQDIFLKYYERFFQTGMPFIALNYNKLVAEPAETMKKLCNLLEIPYFPGRERFWEKEHHQLFGSMGTRRQVENSNSQIKKQENYPQEFKNIVPKIKADIAKDQEFRNVLSKLQDHEMGATEYLSNNTLYKPHWYYWMKAKQKVRQRFPKRVEYNQ